MNIIIGDLIERNISTRVLISLSLVILAIGTIDFLFLILNELSDLTEDYGFTDIFYYSILSMPYRLYDLSSYFCLIGVILGLGTLFDQGEIIGTKVLGKSNTQIALAAFRPVFILMILGLIVSEFYIPDLSQKAEENRLLKKGTLNINQGYWVASEYKINHFRSAPNKETLVGVSIYVFDSNYEPTGIVTAKEAVLENGKWIIREPLLNQIGRNSFKKAVKIDQYTLDYSGKDVTLLLSPRYLSLSELFSQIQLTFSDYRKNQLSLEFWRKLLQPIVTAALLFLALSFLFGPMRDQKSGQRIVIGIGVAFGIDLFQKLIGSISVVSNFPAILAVLVPIIFISLLASLIFRRAN